ncbi:P-selectin glycoprotein ligand 1 [Peromyscus californicus insignis]|uniref:P-selectin glycoprotein ligand 1 n=1 Tax=Peromyscus californicus insignis TaxID=564181 RepID=UPI0022A7BF9E|nr:P-selectin glycoprotein ligand 1 [Peromyscus californicus insignis]
MLPRFLLLLSVLGPGNSLQLWDTWEQGTKEASRPVGLRERRQADVGDDFEYPEYNPDGTDPPELLTNVTNTVTAHLEPVTTTAMPEQRVSGTPESATAQVTATSPAGRDAGGLAVGMLSTESATQRKPTTVEMTIQPAATEAKTSQPAATEAETSQPAATEAGTSQPAATETETSQPAATEAETSQPAATEAETSQPTSTEAETSQPAATEAETTQPAATEAETTQFSRSQVVKSRFTESTATEAPSTEPTATETLSTEPTDSTIFLGPSVSHKDKDEATGHFNGNGLKNELLVTPGSSLATTTPVAPDLIPVKQCLLAILILASLATLFLVCTVVLAVRLSRKNHMYPVRNYSPTEMICISSLLPEGADGAPVTANGDLPKVQDLKTEPSEDRDGDDLTLRSFLP